MIENRVHGVEAQRVDMKFGDPIQRVLNEIISYLVAERAVEIERLSPRRFIAIGEVGTEVGEIISLGSEMVIDHVKDHGQDRAGDRR